MTALKITRDDILASTSGLPAFPRVVIEILASLDDPDANLNVLTNFIAHDPLIAARVLSLANRASEGAHNARAVRDIYTATSMIGMSRIREIALVSSLGRLVNDPAFAGLPAAYWQHSVAVGVCAQELALHITAQISSDSALIAGLLHDIGQLWLFRFHRQAFEAAKNNVLCDGLSIEEAEQTRFATNHSQIGAWLAEHWGLPSGIAAAIRHHHQPDSALSEMLVPVVAIAEVLCSALDLAGRKENRVTHLSTGACATLGLVFNAEIQPLFGRIEARSKYAITLFAHP